MYELTGLEEHMEFELGAEDQELRAMRDAANREAAMEAAHADDEMRMYEDDPFEAAVQLANEEGRPWCAYPMYEDDPDLEATTESLHSKRVRCDSCEALMIQGRFCHETGCRRTRDRYDAQSQEWIRQARCCECGDLYDADGACTCSEIPF